LVVAQVAIAFVLLVASGLMIRSFLKLQAVNPGFTHAEWIQTVRIQIPEALASDAAQVIRMQSEIVRRVSAIPGVTATGFASGLPLESEYRNGIVVPVEGKTSPDQMPPNRAFKALSPGLLAAQGTRLVAGRDFTWEDVFGQRRVAIVSDNMARENWGDPINALGKRIRFGRDGPWNEVIGVTEDVHADGLNHRAPATVYSYVAGRRGVTFAIRSERAGTEAFVREVAAAIHAVNPNLPLAKVRTLNDVYRQSMAHTSFALVLLGIAGAMALALAIVGVYGVLAYAVEQRRREVCIRVALGAQPRQVKRLFVRRGILLASAGDVVGVASATGFSHWISSLLFDVAALDPLHSWQRH
jgi:predicted permease